MNLVGKSFGTALRNLVAARRPVSSPAPAAIAAPPAPPPAPVWQGFVDARSRHHAAGWVRHLDSVARRPTVEVVLRGAGGERVLCRGQADEFSEALQTLEIGDGRHAFFLLFDAPLRPGEDDDVVVRVQGEGYELPNAPAQQRDFTPISYVALDVVNNCNLRCPFCCVDYQGVNKTKFMTEETFRNALALIPFVTEGNFWLSCLHEPTLNPRLTEFIDMVPRDYRRKIFYTTNMAKRMPASYFEFLACSGIHHINISMESFDKDIYEKMRKGARFDIFLENLEAMTKAFGQGGNIPPGFGSRPWPTSPICMNCPNSYDARVNTMAPGRTRSAPPTTWPISTAISPPRNIWRRRTGRSSARNSRELRPRT